MRIIKLWKAPKKKFARRFTTVGFNPKYFRYEQNGIFDGKAYFAKDQTLAYEYGRYYGGGVIEVRMRAADYIAHFQRYEECCQGTTSIQVAIPRDLLLLFNTLTVRRIWHHG